MIWRAIQSAVGLAVDVDSDQVASLKVDDRQSIEKPEVDGRHDKEVYGGDVRCVIADERLPALRRRSASSHLYLATVDWALSIPSLSNSPWPCSRKLTRLRCPDCLDEVFSSDRRLRLRKLKLSKH
jgi:hypothetical protein